MAIVTTLPWLLVAIVPALPAPPALQEDPPPLEEMRRQDRAEFGTESVALVPGTTRLELTLDACVHAVLTRNLGLKIAEYDNAAIRTDVMQALGAFDPELYATVRGGNSEQPTASSFQAPKNQNFNANTGLRGLTSSGMLYDLNYSLDYNRQSPSNPFFGLNPTLASSLGVALTQPLLRGFGSTVTEAPVEQARLLVARGDLDLYQQVQDTAFTAVQAYWSLVAARRNRDSAKEALDVADELVRNNQKRKDAGVMTRLDVLNAATEAARRKEELIRAENGVGRAEDALKFLLSPGTNLAEWRVEIEPTTPAMLRDEALPDEEQAIVAAFTERSDLRALEVDLDVAALSLEVAENQVLPRFDLLGSYGYGSLAGEVPGGANQQNYDLWKDSLQSLRDRDFNSWTVGVDFSHPIGNRSADALERRARIQKERAYMTWLERRMNVVRELRTALRDVADAKAATEASTQARILAEEQLQAEQVRLDNQHSTTFQVREAQRDLFEAQDAETAAITQYEILLAGLERARGRLAQQYGIRWEPARRLEGAAR